jgi:ABC-2 type transport system ATP-binding protein
MHEPEMVILDEPTNGLDPAGIREFRELVRDLAVRGTTVFVSSHILAEVQQMCDDAGILKTGRLVAQGTVASLLQRRASTTIELRTTDDARAASTLAALPWVTSIVPQDGRLVVEAPHEHAADISRALAAEDVWLRELRPRESSLEDFFMEITSEEAARA